VTAALRQPVAAGSAVDDYPLLSFFLTMLELSLFVVWFSLLFKIRISTDIFHSHDLGDWTKAAWTVFIIALPFPGFFIHLIAGGRSLASHNVEQARAADMAFMAYIKALPPHGAAPITTTM
jgi:hypothetical protein